MHRVSRPIPVLAYAGANSIGYFCPICGHKWNNCDCTSRCRAPLGRVVIRSRTPIAPTSIVGFRRDLPCFYCGTPISARVCCAQCEV